MKKISLVICSLALGMVLLFSCEKENSENTISTINSENNQIQSMDKSWYGLIDLERITIISQSIFKSELNLRKSKLDLTSYRANGVYEFQYLNGLKGFAIESNQNDNKFIIINVNKNEVKTRYITINENEIHYENENGVDYKLSNINSESISSDCNLLGPRTGGEGFGDCFSRNWNNFCCDVTGCVAQIASPQFVALGVAIACG